MNCVKIIRIFISNYNDYIGNNINSYTTNTTW